MSRCPRYRVWPLHGVATATAPTAASAAGAAAATTTAATPTAGGTAATKAHAASGSSADEAPIEPEHQRAAAAPNTAQRIGPCSATAHKPAGDCLASGDSDDETDEFTLDAAAVVAEEAVERKEARRVKPWLSELDGCAGVAGAGGGPAGVEEGVEEHQNTNIACVAGT
jgi:hypothetical protein